MGTVSVSLPSDGQTIDAADYNTPITTIVNEINGNLDNANIDAAAAIATSKLADDGGITTAKIADSAVTFAKTSNIWWEEIGRTTLTVAADTITLSSLPAKKYLTIFVTTIATGGTNEASMIFNGDSSANYTVRYSANFGAGTSTGSLSSIGLGATAVPTGQLFKAIASVVNISTSPKIIQIDSIDSGTAGAANAINVLNQNAKWVNTSDAISTITVTNGGTGDFAIGSEIVVLGHN